MNKLKILVTGSSGFLGSYLVPRLEQSFEVYKYDLKEKYDIFALKDLMGIDILVHLAALTNVEESKEDPMRYFWTNAMGTAHLVKLCIEAKAQMWHISSAAAAIPSSSPYAYSKWFAEQMVEQMQRPLKAVIVRPENIYGTGMNKDNLFAKFLYNDSLTVYGSGEQTRDFINITDVVSVISYGLANGWTNIKFDLGTGQRTSVKKIADIFQKYTAKKIVFLKDHSVGISHSRANIKKLAELYPFPLTTNLERDIAYLIKKIH